MAKIKVQNTEVTVITYNDKDYISLTDMVRNMETVPSLLKSGCVTRIPSSFWAYGRRCTIRILIPPNSRELKTRPD